MAQGEAPGTWQSARQVRLRGDSKALSASPPGAQHPAQWWPPCAPGLCHQKPRASGPFGSRMPEASRKVGEKVANFHEIFSSPSLKNSWAGPCHVLSVDA